MLPCLLAACSPPDLPPRLPAELPTEALAHLEPDTLRTEVVAPGVWYRYLWSPRGPWAIHLVEADLRRCELGLDVVHAARQPGKAGGHQRVSEMEGTVGALVAVNGDFFTPEGMPVGPELDDGALRTVRERPAVAWRAGSEPWIGTTRLLGDSVLRAGWDVPLGRSGSEERTGEVVGGYPELLDSGGRVGDLLVEDNPSFAVSRHPRTAVGYVPATRRLWLVVVDGRQGGYSLGMSLPELAELFEALGVPEALNLDGGGSSVMIVRGEAVNRPSDASGERAVVNALALRRSASDYCGPVAGAGPGGP